MKQNIYYYQLLNNCETPIKQTHRKAEETLEFKLTKSGETISLKPPVSIEKLWRLD